MSAATVNNIPVPGKSGSADIPWNKKKPQQKTVTDWIIDIVIGVLIAAIVVVVLYPLWFVVIASVSDPDAVSNGTMKLLPVDFSTSGYQLIFKDNRLWTGYRNTIIYSVLGTLLNMVVTLPMAFALSRREWKPRRVIMFLLTFTMFFAGGLIPNYVLYKDLGILNSMWVFILPSAVNVYNLIIARSFFESSIPESLFEAAKIDGMSYFGYFIKIALPLSSAILAVIGLYYFVYHWNDYMTGLVYIQSDQFQPLQVVLQKILLAGNTVAAENQSAEIANYAGQIKYGVIIVASLPLLIVYPFLQKYFNKGVMIGAVKG